MRSPVQQQAARGGPAGSSVPGFFLAGGNRAHDLALVIKKADGSLAVWRDHQRQARRAAGIAELDDGIAVVRLAGVIARRAVVILGLALFHQRRALIIRHGVKRPASFRSSTMERSGRSLTIMPANACPW